MYVYVCVGANLSNVQIFLLSNIYRSHSGKVVLVITGHRRTVGIHGCVKEYVVKLVHEQSQVYGPGRM